MHAATDLALAPRSTIGLAATTLWGGFFDTTYAFRFGEPSHDVTVARLTDAVTGDLLADAFHFPLGRGHARRDLGLAAAPVHEGGEWWLALSCRRLAQSLRLDVPGYDPADDWFHLAPGFDRRVRLTPRDGIAAAPHGTVSALNGEAVRFDA